MNSWKRFLCEFSPVYVFPNCHFDKTIKACCLTVNSCINQVFKSWENKSASMAKQSNPSFQATYDCCLLCSKHCVLPRPPAPQPHPHPIFLCGCSSQLLCREPKQPSLCSVNQCSGFRSVENTLCNLQTAPRTASDALSCLSVNTTL